MKLEGFLLVNKPSGPSSAQVVGRLKWLLKNHQNAPKSLKIGHGGTLDPLATGLLPIGIGKATKQLQPLLEGPKTYEFIVEFGKSTTTQDAEGEVVHTSEKVPTAAEIRQILPQFTGEITQIPPVFSALKVNGQRAYALARQGKTVELQPRQITIHNLEFLEQNGNYATFRASVSKGTYIRTLGADLAVALGSVGHLTHLCRTAHGPFVLSQSIPLETLDKLLQSGDITPHILPLLPVPAAG